MKCWWVKIVNWIRKLHPCAINLLQIYFNIFKVFLCRLLNLKKPIFDIHIRVDSLSVIWVEYLYIHGVKSTLLNWINTWDAVLSRCDLYVFWKLNYVSFVIFQVTINLRFYRIEFCDGLTESIFRRNNNWCKVSDGILDILIDGCCWKQWTDQSRTWCHIERCRYYFLCWKVQFKIIVSSNNVFLELKSDHAIRICHGNSALLGRFGAIPFRCHGHFISWIEQRRALIAAKISKLWRKQCVSKFVLKLELKL